MQSIEIYGKPFACEWNDSGRRIANHGAAYELISFKCEAETDSEKLRQSLPVQIERCKIKNPDWQPDLERAINDWNEHNPADAPLPLDAELLSWHCFRGLPVEPGASRQALSTIFRDPKNGLTPEAAGHLQAGLLMLEMSCSKIVEETLGGMPESADIFSFRRAQPSIDAVRLIFADGSILLLREARQVPVPDEARLRWTLDAVPQILSDSEANAAKAKNASTKLQEARHAATMNSKEALSKWMRFAPAGTRTETRARIESAVRIYITIPEMRSFAKIAKEFKVSRKTVCQWFKLFEKETGLPVVSFVRHESPLADMKADAARTRREGGIR